MRKTPKLPRRFADWGQYGDAFALDVINADWGLVRCRRCRHEWELEHYKGKLVQRAHVCVDGCNGKPRPRRGHGRPPSVVVTRQRKRFGRKHAVGTPNPWDGVGPYGLSEDERRLQELQRRERKLQQRLWWTYRTVEAAKVDALNRLFEEAQTQADPLRYLMAQERHLREVDRAVGR